MRLTYLRKHCDEGVHDNLCLGQVCGGHLHKDVSSIDKVWSQTQSKTLPFLVKDCHLKLYCEGYLILD